MDNQEDDTLLLNDANMDLVDDTDEIQVLYDDKFELTRRVKSEPTSHQPKKVEQAVELLHDYTKIRAEKDAQSSKKGL